MKTFTIEKEGRFKIGNILFKRDAIRIAIAFFFMGLGLGLIC